MNKVAVSKCDTYGSCDRAIRSAVDGLGGISSFVKRGDKVLLKPNTLGGFAPEKSVTTRPEVLRSAIRLVKSAGGKVFVGDSPGGKISTEEAFRICGFLDVIQEEKAEFIPFETPLIVDNDKALVYKQVVIEKRIKEMDVVINLPKLKTHSLTLLTCAVKNLYGCVPGDRKAQLHFRFADSKVFSRMLLDIESVVRPGLTIVDGIIGMEGAGPSNGTPKKAGFIIAGASCHAVDAVCCDIMGMDRRMVFTQAEYESHYGRLHIDISGDKIENMHFKLPHTANPGVLPHFIRSAMADNILPYPKVDKAKCIGCMVCAKNCPAKTIHMKDKKADIGYKRCIRCFCCQELCPHDAIDIKKSLISRLYDGMASAYSKIKMR